MAESCDILGPYEKATIRILTGIGSNWTYSVPADFPVSPSFKLVSIRQQRPLCDERKLNEEGIIDNDELLLLKRNPTPLTHSDEESVQRYKAPTMEEIVAATQSLPEEAAPISPVFAQPSTTPDFTSELRRIMVSLVECSYRMIGKHPDVAAIFADVDEMLRKPLLTQSGAADSNRSCEVPREALQKLIEMGFDEKRATIALKLKKNCTVSATELLLSDAVLEEESTSPEEAASAAAGTAETVAPPVDGPPQHMSVASAMLKCFQAFKRRAFKPNAKALVALRELGFAETDILDALCMHNNSQDAACEWLLGDRRPTEADLRSGLDADCPMYSAMLSNPVIQLGLCTPKTMLAMLHILEKPSNLNRFLSDPVISPLLQSIFTIYHGEKHSLGRYQQSRP